VLEGDALVTIGDTQTKVSSGAFIGYRAGGCRTR
jgi:uncharacterized cupin superfamily protein